jgi:colanic acid biosynthesis glycosyl transferase WcaI
MASFAENPIVAELFPQRAGRRSTSSLERLVVHDYSGHPFQVQLSRELASRGYAVLHLHCPSYRSGKGELRLRSDDPPTLAIDEVRLATDFDKYSLWRRPLQERAYARRLIRRVAKFSPDIVLSGNTPLIAQRMFRRECERRGVPFVFWHQDLYSLPIRDALRARVPVIGALLGSRIVRLEASTLLSSDAVVSISEDFLPQLRRWGVPDRKLNVIENWAPLAELPLVPRRNAWARRHRLEEKRVLLYSGTLGAKHNPELLVHLARQFRVQPDVQIVVISEGVGADLLAEAVAREGLTNLLLLGFQPYERLPEVLASADVLVAILEPEAGTFAVPSKVLTYLCAARPVLGAIPPENLAAYTILRSGGGIVVDPRNPEAFTAAAAALLGDPVWRTELGNNARAYAEATFDIGLVADGFEQILDGVWRHGRAPC